MLNLLDCYSIIKFFHRLLYIRGTKAQNDIALAMVKQIAGGHPLEVPIDSPKAMLEPAAASNMTDFTIPGHIVREVLLAVDGMLCLFIPDIYT